MSDIVYDCVYRVKAGESWSSISKQEYGDARRFAELQRANPEVKKLLAGAPIRLPRVKDLRHFEPPKNDYVAQWYR